MKKPITGGEAIRLTNRTAKALREQARRQQFILRLSAVILSVVLSGLSVYLGMQRILFVPLVLLGAIALDALLLALARSRYLQLTGQAICTEAAARIMRGERAEQQRIMQAQRDLEKIKADLSAPREDKRPAPEPDDEDEDLFGDTPMTTARMPRATAQTEASAPIPAQAETVHRRRRQPRLQVIQGEQAK